MNAIDTNVLVRFLTCDDDSQAAAATNRISAGVFIPHSVLMEAEWVLRSGYGWGAQRINNEFVDLIALECVDVDQADALHWALDRHRQGADWADMLHLVASSGQTNFWTFDRRLASDAGDEPPVPIEMLK